MTTRILLSLVLLTAAFRCSSLTADSVPPNVPGVVVLFGKDGDLTANWQRADKSEPKWKVKDGVMTAGGGDIFTKHDYSDFQLHVEFKVPLMPDKKGQQRGNSGIKLHGRYEIQILDSFGKAEPGMGDCGALYQQAAPLFNACKAPNEWQTFDITFRSPRLGSEGQVEEAARVTVVHNGITVLNNQIVRLPTGRRGGEIQSKSGAIRLQDHRCPVEFRNIWVLPLPAKGASHY